jgi:hypothetical protein
VSFPFDLHSAAVFDSHIPYRFNAVPLPFTYHTVLLRLWIVSFPFDLHSAAMFDAHIPCPSQAVPLSRHEYSFLKATS